ncbi:MAG TPA: PGPGW domain-containing protein [Chthoniobacterales bacterium]|nr:PGPGW domain-containing protein [Chthoniobacterales bacterium]
MPEQNRPQRHRHPFAARKYAWQRWLNAKLGLDRMPVIRKVIWSVLGITVLLIGVAMTVLPGPAIIVIPLGLAILGSEYAWALRVIRRGSVFVGRKIKPKKRAEPVST